ncbi:uncharacterized protein [Physcomitrium patens]|uniref:Uncharacterized protein n=1 Tax=Physcomitrium patens TaxID=3218 RepID=A0A2K1JD30_PHYPA|nr:uncharacterized protein LOC112292288 isoform X1 [Physcomitrium patens]XP_024396376.1 uncharacterized protein LOC112292288 isoform X1 [Physcomitrium patens]XP_024396378.1 uncharacterized protein LOC112292288 isoform X1 [Physcomitrium patens]XP_024396379.1 uncharacterized protein LOC112292288 isoform X1 [Physcomitrium patens]XP_024396380.1 uncharacterized protein LOC112292288 isoform X1 [Physcomitrium patens]PNR39434.1 hypothetical protein PHYPA_019712 [Physcomitrium patens]|eukprot:XP_024396375.1 uncharacterized protein LOC112292288 isoform X1 [Physcomitrella patens]
MDVQQGLLSYMVQKALKSATPRLKGDGFNSWPHFSAHICHSSAVLSISHGVLAFTGQCLQLFRKMPLLLCPRTLSHVYHLFPAFQKCPLWKQSVSSKCRSSFVPGCYLALPPACGCTSPLFILQMFDIVEIPSHYVVGRRERVSLDCFP